MKQCSNSFLDGVNFVCEGFCFISVGIYMASARKYGRSTRKDTLCWYRWVFLIIILTGNGVFQKLFVTFLYSISPLCLFPSSISPFKIYLFPLCLFPPPYLPTLSISPTLSPHFVYFPHCLPTLSFHPLCLTFLSFSVCYPFDNAIFSINSFLGQSLSVYILIKLYLIKQCRLLGFWIPGIC